MPRLSSSMASRLATPPSAFPTWTKTRVPYWLSIRVACFEVESADRVTRWSAPNLASARASDWVTCWCAGDFGELERRDRGGDAENGRDIRDEGRRAHPRRTPGCLRLDAKLLRFGLELFDLPPLLFVRAAPAIGRGRFGRTRRQAHDVHPLSFSTKASRAWASHASARCRNSGAIHAPMIARTMTAATSTMAALRQMARSPRY